MKITDLRATTITVPLEAPLRHSNGAHWGRFVRTIIELDSNGDRLADFQLELDNAVSLTIGDFIGIETDASGRGGGAGGSKKNGVLFASDIGSDPWASQTYNPQLHMHDQLL